MNRYQIGDLVQVENPLNHKIKYNGIILDIKMGEEVFNNFYVAKRKKQTMYQIFTFDNNETTWWRAAFIKKLK